MEFCTYRLDVPKGVIVENVNLTESLFTLSYLMKENGINKKAIFMYKYTSKIAFYFYYSG